MQGTTTTAKLLGSYYTCEMRVSAVALLELMRKDEVTLNVRHLNTIMSTLGKAKRYKEAMILFDSIVENQDNLGIEEQTKKQNYLQDVFADSNKEEVIENLK